MGPHSWNAVPAYTRPTAHSELICFCVRILWNKLNISSNTPLCLQASLTEEITNTRLLANQLNQDLQWQNVRIANLQVRFMNTADVNVVVTVLATFKFKFCWICRDVWSMESKYILFWMYKMLKRGVFVYQQNKFLLSNSSSLCNARYTVDICKRVHVVLPLDQHRTHSHSISHISLQTQRKFN